MFSSHRFSFYKYVPYSWNALFPISIFFDEFLSYNCFRFECLLSFFGALCVSVYSFAFFFQFSFTWLVFLCSFVYFAILLYLSTIYILYHTHSLYVWVSFILTRLQINFLRDWMEAYNNNNWISFFVMMKRNYVIYLE